MVIVSTPRGYCVTSMYARRAAKPLPESVSPSLSSWDVLGTNLSRLDAGGSLQTEPDRLILIDSAAFPTLNFNLDDLIDAFVQSVLSATAIDHMCSSLLREDGSLDLEAFRSINPDEKLLAELLEGGAKM